MARQLPSGSTTWRARYIDPDTRKPVRVALPSDCTTEEQRAAWAIEKAKELEKRRRELDAGAATKKNMGLDEAVARFYEDNATLRPQTLRAYRLGTDAMLTWMRQHRIELADELRGEHLKALRGWLANKPLMRQEKGNAKNRAHVPTSTARSAYTVNRELAPIKTCLEHLRQLGLVPLLSRDAILDNLKRVKTPRPVPEYLRTSELKRLFEAALRHDAETFDLTRDEKGRGLDQGSSPRFDPILPYLAVVLLTGMRADEACSLRWSAVDLEAEPAGTITLRPAEVKTKQGRMIDLAVSSVLQELLAAMKLRTPRSVYVFGDRVEEADRPATTYDKVEAARRRLKKVYGAPSFSWQQLRVTCGTYLANAPGIFGAASAYREARQLGHSVTVAEKHYLGVVHVNSTARTLEAAMGIESVARTALGLRGRSRATPRRSAR